jgi:hypothetical protein
MAKWPPTVAEESQSWLRGHGEYYPVTAAGYESATSRLTVAPLFGINCEERTP